MTARPSPIFPSSQRRHSTTSSQPFSIPPKPSTTSSSHSRHSHRYSPIDLSEIEIVDLTDPSTLDNSSQPTSRRTRPSDSPSLERPAKRIKGKGKEVYISLEGDQEELLSPSPSPPPPPSQGSGLGRGREKSPASGLLSLHKCVICLDSPTDLVATPCGHLFCDFCIRSALKTGQAGRGRGVPPVYSGTCPICRGKITTKSLIPLEIKVRTLG